MKTFQLKSNLQSYLSDISEGKIIGFVPTMGALHEGHMSLINAASIDCDIVVCSIFVNRMQFNNSNDFGRYPRILKDDISRLENVDCDILYCPEESDLYIHEEKAKYFDFNSLDKYMEGIERKGHFQGVATIIEKLFKILCPDKAYFGEKDLQQLQIIKHITKTLNLDVEIVGSPTIRTKSGLAMSSRNQLLSEETLKIASLLYKSLTFVRDGFLDAPAYELIEKAKQNILNHPDLKLEYFEIVSLETLHPINNFLDKNKNAVCIAASIAGVRLIDNIIF